MGFKPEVETNYLRGLPEDVRKNVFEEELATVVAEANLFHFRKKYRWDGSVVVDPVSGEGVGEVISRGNNHSEEMAWKVIEKGVGDESSVVVNFSPANKDLGYGDGAVDVWDRDGSEVIWSRYTVRNSFESLTNIYQAAGGEKIDNELEMLAKPIITDKIGVDKLLSRLDIFKENVKINFDQIRQTVQIIIDDFVNKFGENFVLDNEKVFRAFSAAMNEVKNISKNIFSYAKQKIEIGWQQLRRYAFDPMIMTRQNTYGCASENVVGSFVTSVGGWVRGIVGKIAEFVGGKTFDCPRCKGKIESGRGIEKCPHCGMTKQEAGSVCD